MQVSFARPDAMQGTLVETLTDVRPTMFLGVPRVWEKIEASPGLPRTRRPKHPTIRTWFAGEDEGGRGGEQRHHEGHRGLGQGPGPRRQLCQGDAHTPDHPSLHPASEPLTLRQVAGDAPHWGYYFATPIFKKIRAQLGLDRCKLQASGAAPITKQTLEYLMSVDVPVLDLYGMSESSGPQCVSVPGGHKIGSCGRAMPGTELVVHNPDPRKGEGELIYRGRHIFMGYMHNTEVPRGAC